VTLAAKRYLVVFASGKNRRPTAANAKLRTNFKLGIAGEYLGLSNAKSPRLAVSELAPQSPEPRHQVAFWRDSLDAWRDFTTEQPHGCQRCGHPGQQHGRRMPPRSLSMPTSMRRFLVAAFLAEVTQQIHSFRASGVISAQRRLATAFDSMALRKSAGSSWIVPPAISRFVIDQTVPVWPNAKVSDRHREGNSGRAGRSERTRSHEPSCGPAVRLDEWFGHCSGNICVTIAFDEGS